MAGEEATVEEVVEEVIEEEVAEVVEEEAEPVVEEVDEEEMVVSIGEESPPQEDDDKAAAPWVKELRKNHRETQRENKELKSRLDTYEATKPIVLGPKPTLENSGEGYDAEVYEKDLATWYETKAQVDAQVAKGEEEKEAQDKDWQTTIGTYKEAAVKLKEKVAGFDEAEVLVKETLNIVQQGVIIKYARNPAMLILALGKNPDKARELSSIKDHAEFIWAAAEMEKELKVTKKKVAFLSN